MISSLSEDFPSHIFGTLSCFLLPLLFLIYGYPKKDEYNDQAANGALPF